MMALCLLLVLLLSLMVWRFVGLMREPPASILRGKDAPLSVCVVLGSGGHTSEMMRAIKAFPPVVWRANRPFYVVSSTDKHSASLASEFERDRFRRCCRLITIPRAREVGQSYFLSVFTTLRALWSSIHVIIAEKPDVIVVNGPGVCVPVVAAALLIAAFSPRRYYRRPAVAFMESYTCVHHMSLSGKLLMPFCDVCTVQWQPLYNAWLKKRWGSKQSLFYVGSNGSSSNSQGEEDIPLLSAEWPGKTHSSSKERVALVTVGSTQFDSLIKAVDNDETCETLASWNITRLLIQKGDSLYKTQVSEAHGVTVEVFAYRPKLHELIQEAALVISHAGAGTILETLECRRPLVVVPNRALMSNHQLELAEALAAARYLFCLQVGDIGREMKTLNFNKLRVFPGMNTAALQDALLPLFGAEDFIPSV